MNKVAFNRSFIFLAYIILASIFIISVSFSYTSLLIKYPELAVGVTIDLTLVAPLLYLFLIWKTKIPKTTVVPFFVVTVILASFLIPADQQFYLTRIKTWVIPFVEILLLSFVAFTTYKTVKIYRNAKDKNADILDVGQEVIDKLIGIPILAKLAVFEFSVLYYAFFSWRKPELTDNSFTYHKSSGKLTLYGAIIFIIGAETVVIHYLLSLWNFYVAWILTLSSLYVLFQLFAHLKAVYQRPIEIIGDKLFIRYGLFSGAEVNLDNIESVENSAAKPTNMECVKQVSLLADLEQTNVKMQLAESEDFFGFYGKKDKFKTLLLFVDEPAKFIDKLKPNDSN